MKLIGRLVVMYRHVVPAVRPAGLDAIQNRCKSWPDLGDRVPSATAISD